jgi:hypothetical protein
MDPRRGPPFKTVGLVKLTMVAAQAGLVVDPGSKVT